LEELRAAGRAAAVETGDSRVWFPVEQVAAVRFLYGEGEHAASIPAVAVPPRAQLPCEHREAARLRLLRGHMEIAGVTTVEDLAERVALGVTDVEHGLVMLEAQGFVLRGRFSPDADRDEWCDRRLLARIHR